MLNRLAILTIAALLPLTGGASIAAASQAEAHAPLGQVTVSGTVADCESGSSPSEVTITAGSETKVDNSLSGNSNSYAVTFKKIPKSGTVTGKPTVTCEDDSQYASKDITIKGAPSSDPIKLKKQNLAPPPQ
ncbi:hypothetical protein [Streptomyces sp. NBC_01538]|uniref:hypothetical protein n=1 Tax=Streptomyces sp. NBC_01538 TaxID=2903897 RepID=UPI00386BCB8F